MKSRVNGKQVYIKLCDMMYNNIHLYNTIRHVDFYAMLSHEVFCALGLFQVTICDPHFITAQSVLGSARMEEP